MIIKQYVIDLSADYDMQIIRDRVARARDAYDGFPGLGLKAFLIRQKGRYGAPINQYAPIYLWPRVAPLWGFVAGPGFHGVAQSFGRPSIRTWLGLTLSARQPRPDPSAIRSVVREDVSVPVGTDLADLHARETREAQRAVETEPELMLRAVGLNIETWSLVRIGYWTCPQDGLPEGAQSFEVLHSSAPGFDDLAFGEPGVRERSFS